MDPKKIKELKKQALAEAEKAEKEIKRIAVKVRDYIKKNPKKAAGIAAGAVLAISGAVAGIIVAKRKGNKKRK